MFNKLIFNKHSGFTLIEILLVIAIAGILASITLQLNRSRIADMQAMNEREERIFNHDQLNRNLTETNYFNNQKISSATIQYTNIISGYTTLINQSQQQIDWGFQGFAHHTLSGQVLFKKIPLSLGCEITSGHNILTLTTKKSGKLYCFQLNSALCNRSSCKDK